MRIEEIAEEISGFVSLDIYTAGTNNFPTTMHQVVTVLDPLNIQYLEIGVVAMDFYRKMRQTHYLRFLFQLADKVSVLTALGARFPDIQQLSSHNYLIPGDYSGEEGFENVEIQLVFSHHISHEKAFERAVAVTLFGERVSIPKGDVLLWMLLRFPELHDRADDVAIGEFGVVDLGEVRELIEQAKDTNALEALEKLELNLATPKRTWAEYQEEVAARLRARGDLKD